MSRFVLIYNVVFHTVWCELFFSFFRLKHAQSELKKKQSELKNTEKSYKKDKDVYDAIEKSKTKLEVSEISYHPLWLYFWRYQCNMTEKELGLLYSWKCFPNSSCSHWLLWSHMISINEAVSRQNLWAGKLQNLWRRRVTVHCYPQMLTDDRRYSEV